MSAIGQLLIGAVRSAAAEKPDFVYKKPPAGPSGIEPCMYVFEQQPSCIVGFAAWNLGLIDATFEDSEDNTSSVDGLARAIGFDLDAEERDWLEYAQNNQDCGSTWANAVADADAETALPVLA